MFEVERKGVKFFIAPTKAGPNNVAVSICIPVRVSACALAHMKGMQHTCPATSFPVGTEEAAVCYAMYLKVKQALDGTTSSFTRSKVYSVECGAQGGMFYINWLTNGIIASVRKSIGVALKAMQPFRMSTIYNTLIRDMNSTPQPDTFMWAANAVHDGLMHKLQIGVVGKITIKDTKVGGAGSRKSSRKGSKKGGKGSRKGSRKGAGSRKGSKKGGRDSDSEPEEDFDTDSDSDDVGAGAGAGAGRPESKSGGARGRPKGLASKPAPTKAADKVADIIDKAIKKRTSSDPGKSKKEPKAHTECDHTNTVELPLRGWEATIMLGYLRSKDPRLRVSLSDKGVIVSLKRAQWETVKSKVAAGISDYAAVNFSKIKVDPAEATAHRCISNGELGACHARDMLKNKFDAAAITAALKRGL